MSEENVDLVRRLFDQLASRLAVNQALDRLSDEALAEFYDPEVEWVPPAQSLLAVDTYRGFDGVREFWADYLSAWEEFSIEALDLTDAGEQVAVVIRSSGRLRGVDVDQTRSTLLTMRAGTVIRVQGFGGRADAAEAARRAD